METAEKGAVTPARKASGVEGVNARQVVREFRKLAIEYQQHGDPFYVTVWTAPELAENTTVPEYDPTSDTGYQRLPKNPRVHRAARYLEAGGKFPGAILLSIRGKDRNLISPACEGRRICSSRRTDHPRGSRDLPRRWTTPEVRRDGSYRGWQPSGELRPRFGDLSFRGRDR